MSVISKCKELLYKAPWGPKLFAFFSQTPIPSDPEQLRQTLGRLILFRVIVLSVLLGLSLYQVQQRVTTAEDMYLVFWPIALTYAISLLNAIWLRYTKNPKLFGYGQLFLDVILATLAIYATGSMMSVSLYLLVVLCASLVFGRNSAVAIAAIAGLCYSVLASGLISMPSGSLLGATSIDIMLVYLSLVSIALISGHFAHQLALATSEAQRNAVELLLVTQNQKQLFDEIADGIITLDNNALVTNINQAARMIIGLPHAPIDSLIGKQVSKILGEIREGSLDFLHESMTVPKSAIEISIVPHASSAPVRIRCTVRLMHNSIGRTEGKMLIINDLSHLRSMEEQLELHEKVTKLLSERAQHGDLTSEMTLMVGDSQIMQRVSGLVERVAHSDASVLITGESGTGKELIARSIFIRGPRSNKPFVAINCGAIPENLIESELFGHKRGAFTGAVNDNPGLFRQAQNGTIFLDEIGELPLHLQTKLLRVLQERKVRGVGETVDTVVDVRILAATNKDLKAEIKAKRFREDLYYRLNVVNIPVPPLRDRKEDIPHLVSHFVGKYCNPDKVLPKVSPEALQYLMSYPFPGNIRELENIVERALVLDSQAILPEHLPEEVRSQQRQASLGSSKVFTQETEIIVLPIDLESILSKVEQEYLLKALERSGGIKKEAAKLLGLNFRSMRYRLKKYGIGQEDELEQE